MPAKKIPPLPQPQKKMPKNGLLSLAILVLAAVIIFGAVFMPFQNKQDTPGVIAPNVTIPSPQDFSCYDDDCYLKSAAKTKDQSTCEKILGEGKKQECYGIFAGDSLDICLKLTNYREKIICVEKHAINEHSTVMCENLKVNESNNCIEKIEPCYFKPREEAGLCNALYRGNFSYCYGDENCLLSYAEQKNDEVACGYLSDLVGRAACKSVVLHSDSPCNSLSGAKADACLVSYAMASNDFYACTKISHASIYELQCYAASAHYSIDIKQCDNVDVLNRWECYKSYSLSSKDISACAMISEFASLSKTRCYVDFSKIFGMPDTCEGLVMNFTYNNYTSAGNKEECYKAGIINNSKLSLQSCRGISSENWRLRCYTNIANLINDSSVCNELELQENKNFCLSNARRSS